MLIVGVDPGETTGFVVWGMDEKVVLHSEQLPAGEAVIFLWGLLERTRLDIQVAVERYQIVDQTMKSTRQYDALHVTGALRFKCQQFNRLFEQHLRSDAKALSPDGRLRQLGVHRRGKTHINDAMRVVLVHLVKHHRENYKQLVTGSGGPTLVR